jgi:Holliday junction resolvase-like predicted endonuclease
MSLKMLYHRVPLSSEKNIVYCLTKICESRELQVKTEFKLPFGSIDVVAWNDKEVLLYEVKHNAGFNEIAHALGQLLIYREQIKQDNRKVIAIIHTRTHNLSKEEIHFLKNTLAKYDVELNAEGIIV